MAFKSRCFEPRASGKRIKQNRSFFSVSLLLWFKQFCTNCAIIFLRLLVSRKEFICIFHIQNMMFISCPKSPLQIVVVVVVVCDNDDDDDDTKRILHENSQKLAKFSRNKPCCALHVNSSVQCEYLAQQDDGMFFAVKQFNKCICIIIMGHQCDWWPNRKRHLSAKKVSLNDYSKEYDHFKMHSKMNCLQMMQWSNWAR